MSAPVRDRFQAGSHRRRWLSSLLEHLLPGRCLLCGSRAGQQAICLCPGCRGDLSENRPCCPRCAEPLERPEALCGRCLRRTPPFDAGYVPLRYLWPLDGLVTRFKFSGDLAAGRALARLFVEQARRDEIARPDLLIPVPLHLQRLRRRGYDQALELARAIGAGLGVPVSTRLLHRVRATSAQTDLDLKARRRNVRDAFAVDPRGLPDLPGPSMPTVALVDDVMTTGSTLAECARMLRRSGFERIQAWAIARAPARTG